MAVPSLSTKLALARSVAVAADPASPSATVVVAVAVDTRSATKPSIQSRNQFANAPTKVGAFCFARWVAGVSVAPGRSVRLRQADLENDLHHWPRLCHYCTRQMDVVRQENAETSGSQQQEIAGAIKIFDVLRRVVRHFHRHRIERRVTKQLLTFEDHLDVCPEAMCLPFALGDGLGAVFLAHRSDQSGRDLDFCQGDGVEVFPLDVIDGGVECR